MSRSIRCAAHRCVSALCLTIATILALPALANAAPSQRGFQIPIDSISEESLDDIATNWKANILRVQIANDYEIEGATGAAYVTIINNILDKLDAKLPLLEARGLKVIICLSSPPGGLQTHEAPSHLKMFSQPALQDEYVAIWRAIASRYASNQTIAGFDLLNEPATRKSLLHPSARNWTALSVETVAAVRQYAPTKLIILKSLYGDPSKLTSLPPIADANLAYAYNSYFFNKYQHSGVYSAPFSTKRPSAAAITRQIRRNLAPFYFKLYTRVQKKLLNPAMYPPKVIVGEVAVSACALEAGTFMNDLLTALESDVSAIGRSRRDQEVRRYSRALQRWKNKRRRGRKPSAPVFNSEDFHLDIAHTGYTVHAYGEFQGWDPRYSCNASGQYAISPTDTDRGIVIKGFFSKN
jgi:hypothetical protein